MFARGYEFALFDGLSSFYLREGRESACRVTVPANCIDDFVSSRARWRSQHDGSSSTKN